MSSSIAHEPKKSSRRFSSGKLWIFRIVLLVASNLIVLGAIEFGARFAGIGYPTNFFAENASPNGSIIAANHRFFWSFFPKALSRSPQAFQFFSEKRPKTIRIFLFGESAAMGDPEPAFGMARVLEKMLESRSPELDFEVINLAVTAINSHVIRPIALEAEAFDSDFWCLYIGNNEVHGQFGPGTVFGSSESSLPLIHASLAVKRTRIGQIANTLAGAFNRGDRTDWEGMAMFADREIYADDPRLQAVYANFNSNLNDIANAGARAGAHVLLSSVAVNLKGSSPFKSAMPTQLAAPEIEKWQTLISEGKQLLDNGLASDALLKLQESLKIFAEHAETHYLIGQSHSHLKDYASAQKAYIKARDLDGLRFRTDSEMNRIIKKVASDHPSQQLSFVDAEAMVAFNAPTRIPGDELFWDHVHLRFPGNYLVALTFAQAIEKKLFTPEQINALPAWISLGDCAQSLTLTRWNDYQMTQSMRQRLFEEPFRSQSIHKSRDERLKNELQQHLVGISPEAFSVHQNLFIQSLKTNPKDAVLQDMYARYLLSQGKMDEATEQWSELVKQVPSHLMAHYQKGTALALIPQRAEEAEESLRRALEIRPATVDIMVSLGKSLLTQKRYQQALDEFKAALSLRPTSIEGLVASSQALAALGRNSEATEFLEQARTLAPNNERVQAELKKLSGP